MGVVSELGVVYGGVDDVGEVGDVGGVGVSWVWLVRWCCIWWGG